MVKQAVRGGASLRELAAKANISKRFKYICPKCGKKRVKRVCFSIWKCRACATMIAGAAYSLSSEAGSHIKKLLEEMSHS
ncbi:MAG: hypothetical protein QXN01_00970 [Candidatus Anstonellales archaeon]